MHRLAKYGIFTFLFCATTLFSQPCATNLPCQIGFGLFCGNVEGFGELLYMRPARCNLNFAITDPRSYIPPRFLQSPQTTTEQVGPQGELCGVRPTYHVGFRVGGSYIAPSHCFDLTGRYTRMHTSDHAHAISSPPSGGLWAILLNSAEVTANLDQFLAPPFVQVVLFNPSGDQNQPSERIAAANARAIFNLDAGDLTLGMRSVFCCNLWARGFAGVAYTSLYHKFSVDYEGTLHPGMREDPLLDGYQSQVLKGAVTLSSHAFGVGPQVGGVFTYELGCGFGVGGRFAVGLLGGSRRASYFQFYETTTTATQPQILSSRTTDVRGCSETCVSRMLSARLGVNYSFCCPCAFVVVVEFGYEFLSYEDILLAAPTFRMDRGISDVPCVAYTLDGFYLHLTAGF